MVVVVVVVLVLVLVLLMEERCSAQICLMVAVAEGVKNSLVTRCGDCSWYFKRRRSGGR